MGKLANPTLQEILDSETFKATVAQVREDLVRQVMSHALDSTEAIQAKAEYDALHRVTMRLKLKVSSNGK